VQGIKYKSLMLCLALSKVNLMNLQAAWKLCYLFTGIYFTIFCINNSYANLIPADSSSACSIATDLLLSILAVGSVPVHGIRG
jgi:hypothetical protein